jgi:outer membrane murein-binding lipoprotein Lpp
MSETIKIKTSRKDVVTALGLICAILVACLGGAIATYTLIINDKNNTISLLKSQISELNSKVTDLQNQIASNNSTINSLSSNITKLLEELDSILNGSSSVEYIVMSDPSAWVNRSVMVEGVLSGLIVFPTFEHSPWDHELSSGNQTIGVSLSANVNESTFWNGSEPVRIYGVVEKDEISFTFGPSEVTYYIEAETVEPL